MNVRLQKIGSFMTNASVAEMYRSLVSAWQDPDALVIGGASTVGLLEELIESPAPVRLVDRMMLADQVTYMVDDQLAKVDRVSMAVSMEVRVPFVDHRLVEYAWRLPAGLKIRNGQGKWPLRRILQRYVPKHIVERPKMGFSVPIDEWLRGPLRGWVEELIAPERLAREGLLEPTVVRREWDALLGGHRRGALGLWAVLMLQAWRERWSS
jgi:asparagine synthase (glutamine-hydrolysing)